MNRSDWMLFILIIGILILMIAQYIRIFNLQSQINDLPNTCMYGKYAPYCNEEDYLKYKHNKLEYMNELEFCWKFTNEHWFEELGEFSYYYDLCVNGSVYDDYVKYEKDYLIKSTRVCEDVTNWDEINNCIDKCLEDNVDFSLVVCSFNNPKECSDNKVKMEIQEKNYEICAMPCFDLNVEKEVCEIK